MAAAVAALESEMTALDRAVAGADLRPAGWLDPAALTRVVRTAYDPAQPRRRRRIGRRCGRSVGHGGDAGTGCGPTARTTPCTGSPSGPGPR